MSTLAAGLLPKSYRQRTDITLKDERPDTPLPCLLLCPLIVFVQTEAGVKCHRSDCIGLQYHAESGRRVLRLTAAGFICHSKIKKKQLKEDYIKNIFHMSSLETFYSGFESFF